VIALLRRSDLAVVAVSMIVMERCLPEGGDDP
jgi:hypothetical protein